MADRFLDILKVSLLLFLGLFFFTDILKIALQIPYFVSSELSSGDWRNVNLGEGIFTRALKRVVDWIGIVSYWISFGLYVVIVSILGFFAGYILFLGTMFRVYGLLKVFFILLFTVALWPLLWHSINFAVYTIAVSDNALANNVIIAGASLAKVFIPIWLISKTSKISVAGHLKKISFTGESPAYAGGSYAYSSSISHTGNILNKIHSEKDTTNEEDITNEGAEVNIANYPENSDYIEESEDFAIITEQENDTALPSEENVTMENALSFNKKEEHRFVSTNPEGNQQSIKRHISTEQTVHQENHIQNDIKKEEHRFVSANPEGNQQSIKRHISTEQTVHQENHIQNDIKKEVHIENNPQIHSEIKETQNISQHQNDSILKETERESLEHETTITEQNPKISNETIHNNEGLIEEKENDIAPRRHHKNHEEDAGL